MEENVQIQRQLVVIRGEIIPDKRLTGDEKMIYSRIAFFEEYFESAEKCAEYFNFSVQKVQRARRKLEEYGYIKCLRNTGRGKVYKADLDNPINQTYQKQQDRPIKNDKSDLSKITNIDKKEKRTKKELNNMSINTHIAERSEVIEISSEKNVPKPKPEKEPNKWNGYGNPEIDRLFYEWENLVKIPLTGTKQSNRYAGNRLIKKYSENDLLGAIKIVALTKQSNDKYAPNITSLMELEAKFGSLVYWYQKNKAIYEEQRKIQEATEGTVLTDEEIWAMAGE